MVSRIKTLDDFELEYKRGLGVPIHPKPWREVTQEWLARHSEGSGDYNPLYRQPEYAADGRFHSLVASPSFLFSIDFGANASIWGHIPHDDVAMNDLSILYMGADIEWFAPVWLGDRVRSVETPVDIRRTEMRQLGEVLICSGKTEYFNHRAELVARVTNHMLRFVNPGEGVESTPSDTSSQIAPDPLVWARTRRGSSPLYWEDVQIDVVLPTLPKGTYTTTELFLFSLGSLSISRSRKVDDGTIDMGAGGRADPEYARKSRSQTTSFDYGPQRITWLTQIVSDWIGDDGDVISLSAQLRRPNLIGDTNTVVGVVTRVFEESGDARAEVEIAVVNQRDIRTATATAIVRLPRRDAVSATDTILFAPDIERVASVYG